MARLDRRPAERVAVAGIIIQLIAGLMALVVSKYSGVTPRVPGEMVVEGPPGSATAYILMWHALIAIIPWFFSLMHLRQNRSADEESVEWERLQAERAEGGARGSLFETDEIQAFAARNRLRILERYFLPGVAMVMVALFAAVAFASVLTGTIAERHIRGDHVLVCMAAMVGVAFVQLLIGMYAAGMSRQEAWRPLRAGAGYTMLSFIFSMATFFALMLGLFEYTRPDRVMAYVMIGILGLLAIEILSNFILDFYRPRVEGVEPRPSYDSRLLSLLTQPGGILRTVAATLDYQFGFRVSQTWFYRFIESAIAPLLLFQIITLYLLTSFVIVGPEQQGVIETWGKFDGRVLEPGWHWKWPWPVERAFRFTANDVKSLQLGHLGKMTVTDEVLWTAQHYETEYNLMVASKESRMTRGDVPAVNLIVAASTVRYRINDVEKWFYGCSDPEELLESICNREMSTYFASVDFFDVMGPGREGAKEGLRRAMQTALDNVEGAVGKGIGVEIVSVGLEGIHPPVADAEGLAAAFQDKVVQQVQQEVEKLTAEKDAIKTVIEANADASVALIEARSDYSDAVFEAQAGADRFLVQNEAYASAERVFRVREYLSALEDALTDTRLYVLGIKGLDREHIRLNLEDPTSLDLSDIGEFRDVSKEQNP